MLIFLKCIMFILTEPTLPMAAVRYPALLAMVARLISVLGSPALPAAEMITGGVLARPDSTTGNYYQQTDGSTPNPRTASRSFCASSLMP